MVQHAHVQQGQGLGQLDGDLPVCLAGFGNTRGVVVSEDDGRGVQFQTAFDHLARVHAGAVNRPGKQDFIVDDPVAVIQEQAGKYLMGETA